MPCRSDYMEPTQRERLLQETAQLYAYVLHATGNLVPQKVELAANNQYCRDDFVADLCQFITEMTADLRMQIIYNPYNRTARRLADWWEEHEAADRQRVAQEQTELLKQDRYEQVIAKLSDEDIAVLKDQWEIS